MCVLLLFLKIIYLFLERGDGREIERKRNIDVREKHRLFVSFMHAAPGTEPAPQACASTGN